MDALQAGSASTQRGNSEAGDWKEDGSRDSVGGSLGGHEPPYDVWNVWMRRYGAEVRPVLG